MKLFFRGLLSLFVVFILSLTQAIDLVSESYSSEFETEKVEETLEKEIEECVEQEACNHHSSSGKENKLVISQSLYHDNHLHYQDPILKQHLRPPIV